MVKHRGLGRARAVFEHLAQVLKIEPVPDSDAIWRAGVAEAQAFDPERIRLAVWNLWKGHGGVLFEHDFRALCYRSDLLLAQEALLSERSIHTFAERGFETIHAASYRRRDGLRDGVMTASRVASCSEPTRIICKYPEPIFKTPKAALVKLFPILGEPPERGLLVVNVHATLVRSVKGAVEEMLHLVERVPIHEGPMILAGDFNTLTAGYMRAVAKVLGMLGLEHVAIPNDPRRLELDQVFARGLEVRSAVVDTRVRNSDHFPMLIEFRVSR